jgi:Do/DeqQ family serine protease
MKKLWLLFSQTVTVLLAAYFVVGTLQPTWLHGSAGESIAMIEAARTDPTSAAMGSLSGAAKKAAPAVVSINTSKNAPPRSHQGDPWFRFFFGDQGEQAQAGLGSGVIVSPEGYVLTNNHVVEGADEIEVALNDGRHAQARVIGTDPDSDLALLKIELNKLPVIMLGNSDALAVGDRVLAIGNPFGVGQTVTGGIVSALGRNHLGINTFENFIQTDAAINPGNSGGALVDVYGHLMGVNTAIYSRSGGNMGIGFAIPVSTAKQVMDSLLRDGKVTRGWIGVEPNNLSPELAATFGVQATSGVLITGVLQNGPAAQAGLQPGDVITGVAGKGVTNVADLLTRVAALKPGVATAFSLLRHEQTLTLQITPGTRPRAHVLKR